jgi:hypothetical protein
MSKICSKCGIEKEFDSFYKDKGGVFGVRSICKACDIIRRMEFSKKNIDKDRENKKLYRKRHIDKINEQVSSLKTKDPTYFARKAKEYRQRPGSAYKSNRAKWDKVKRTQDPTYKLRRSTSNRISRAIKLRGFSKKSNTSTILGCDWETLKVHMESLFKPGMSWDNYGLWEIDHIVPCFTTDDENELIKLNHYTNLQPLWKSEHLVKTVSERQYG